MDYKEIFHFLSDVKEQISYKPIQKSIEKELKEHIEDRVEEYIGEGISEEEAVHMAVKGMGDGSALGVMMNELHHVRIYWPLLGMVICLFVLGIGNAVMESQIWESGYYIVGIVVFVVAIFKGYPWIVMHTEKVLWSIVGMIFLERSFEMIKSRIGLYIWGYPAHVIAFAELILWGVLTGLLAYRWRRNGKKLIFGSLLLIGGMTFVQYFLHRTFVVSSIIIMIITSFSTVLFIIRYHFKKNKRKYLYIIWSTAILLLIGAYMYMSWPGQKHNLELFLTPEKQAGSCWNDGYNGVLIKSLLSKTENWGEVQLDVKELMEYGTGAWYLEEEQVEKKTRVLNRSLSYTQESVVLKDILPQHYRNNYRIAGWILQYGRIPAIILLIVVALFYVNLFMAVKNIHNPMGRMLAFSCSVCLTLQAILYTLGNFGYQYGDFCNWPILSEGLVSISVNMMLVGMVLSAYRYDTVIDEA